MDLLYIILADAAFGLHLLFVLALGPSTALLLLGHCGGRLALYGRVAMLSHLHCVAVFAMAVGQTTLNQCPLVLLEHTLREAAGETRWYYGSFSVFVVKWLTGYELPVEVIFSLSTLVVVLTVAHVIHLIAPRLRMSLRHLVANLRPAPIDIA